ncbi:MAG: polyphosphate kinase 1 [Halieaceae bacterium]|jgi:polyphosphate kinase|nr:polyphosphate kinase 1 [Halieaceae bacterium]
MTSQNDTENPIKARLGDLDASHFMPREISWISFNARVLQEAADDTVPVIERLRYLGIFSNNLDEFFRVRVAEVRRLLSLSTASNRQQYKALLENIQTDVVALQTEFDRIYGQLLVELQRRKIYLVNERQLEPNQAAYVQQFFSNNVLPELEPILLSDGQSMPNLTDESIYLAVDLRCGEETRYAIMEVPTDRVPRFIEIPRKRGKKGKVFIVLDNIIRYCMAQVFRGVIDVDSSAAYTIKFSRDAELEIDTGIADSLIEKMELSLKRRQKADAVRFVYDAAMPGHLLDFLTKHFNVRKYDSLIAGGRYHNSKDFMSFPNVGPRYLEFKPLPSIPVPRLEAEGSIFDRIRERDVLLYYPYHPFDYIIDLLKTAALDPSVKHIQICLYRVARNSRVCDALINAVHNGKRVLAVVELQARFDEEANINWAERLADNGVEVLFGVAGLKVHSKLICIEREEDGETRFYSHIGTGNFNEKTARLYTDFSLLTYDQGIGRDVSNVFDFLRFNYKRHSYNHLLVSPHSSRSGIEALIDREISNARDGYHAAMTLKCNNLADQDMVMKLYEASQAGVEVRLIIRGMCTLLPNVEGISENIRAISIVDRYLEHPRVYSFYNRGQPKYLIGSADLMTRNLDYRVEVLCPIHDKHAQKLLQDVLDQQWHDNVKARVLDAEQENAMVSGRKSVKIRSQESIHRYLQTGKLPRYPKTSIGQPVKRRRKRKSG